jgi:hypothetical protein
MFSLEFPSNLAFACILVAFYDLNIFFIDCEIQARFVNVPIACSLVLFYDFDLQPCSFVFAEGMNEDGSFIGLYGRKGKPQPTNNQAFATLV